MLCQLLEKTREYEILSRLMVANVRIESGQVGQPRRDLADTAALLVHKYGRIIILIQYQISIISHVHKAYNYLQRRNYENLLRGA